MQYEYATENTQRIEDVAKLINQRVADGWEFVQCVANNGIGGVGRLVLIFRREKV